MKQREGCIRKSLEESEGDDGNVLYLDCDRGCQNTANFTL